MAPADAVSTFLVSQSNYKPNPNSPSFARERFDFRHFRFKNGKGFTVLSIALEKKKETWKKAIETDLLEWPYHVSDLGGWTSQPAKLYGVSSIPRTFLLDEEGKIIAMNLRGPALEDKLSELFD